MADYEGRPRVRHDWWSKSGGVTEFLVNCLPCDATRNFQTDRCYHLVNRVGHRAFYLDEYEPWHEVTPPLPLHQWVLFGPRLKFADTYYGEMTHYGLYRLVWADVRRAR